MCGNIKLDVDCTYLTACIHGLAGTTNERETYTFTHTSSWMAPTSRLLTSSAVIRAGRSARSSPVHKQQPNKPADAQQKSECRLFAADLGWMGVMDGSDRGSLQPVEVVLLLLLLLPLLLPYVASS